jgi:catalase
MADMHVNKVMIDVDRGHLISNMVRHLSSDKKKIPKRQTAIFYKVDPDY